MLWRAPHSGVPEQPRVEASQRLGQGEAQGQEVSVVCVRKKVPRDHLTQCGSRRFARKMLDPASQVLVVLRGGSFWVSWQGRGVPSHGGGAKSGERHFVGSGGSQDLLLQEVLRRGLEVHQLSGDVDVARIEPFDDIKVAVKR